MKKILIGSAIILVIALAVWYFFWSVPAPVQTPPGGDNPFGTPAGSATSTGTSSGDTVTLVTTGGTSVVVPDFTKGKPSRSLGTQQFYALTSNQQTEGVAAQFDIVYGTDSSISIILLKEPLGQARLAAEVELRKIIPLSDTELCALNVNVGPTYAVNEFYSNTNVGLSFCPGAITLPQ